LPLALEMPVMITQNFDVENGIVNRATGIVKQIRYTENKLGERFPSATIPDMTGPTLPNLPPKHAAILAETVDMKF
ncbi:hypothetical protein B0H10DRAFT_1668037, partial [Mycena sp. CBHHK59/15]